MEYPTLYRTIQLDGLSIFCREAGPKKRIDASHQECSSLSSPGFPGVITLSLPTTQALDTAAGRTRTGSITPLTTSLQ